MTAPTLEEMARGCADDCVAVVEWGDDVQGASAKKIRADMVLLAERKIAALLSSVRSMALREAAEVCASVARDSRCTDAEAAGAVACERAILSLLPPAESAKEPKR
jgi:hypothetical protein